MAAALANHGAQPAERFIQEVFWRSYWKGWLEQHPRVWLDYRKRMTVAKLPRRTGIECFDAWLEELVETGYLHNHARMWFASIWIFTLKLPWEAGADLFLRHLLDGDTASNTLSWRWVAGLQTRGKHYVARAENIARYTGGRFNPEGQLDEAPLPQEEPVPVRHPLPLGPPLPAGEVALLLHEDDLCPETLPLCAQRVVAVAGIAVPERRSPAGCSNAVAAFTRGAVADGLARASERFGVAATMLAPDAVADWARRHALPVVTPYAPVGWVAETLAEIEGQGTALHRVLRAWDSACWPHAGRGFFAFRKHVPELIEDLIAA